MDLSQLRTFLAVAELGSLSKASGRLRIAQPALSRQIRLLEEELGVRLFDRHGRGMVPTANGQDLIPRASRVLADLEDLRLSAAGAGAELSGHIAIGLPPTIADLVSVALVESFLTRFPKVTVQLVTAFSGYLQDWLFRGEVDFAVLHDPQTTRTLRAEPLMRESLFLIGAADAGLTLHRPVPFADVVREPLLLPSGRQGLRATLDKVARDAGVGFHVRVETDSYAALKELVRQGHGRTILPLAPIHTDLEAGRLTAAPITDPEPTRTLVLAYPSDRPVSRLARFAGDTLREIAAGRMRDGVWAGKMLSG